MASSSSGGRKMRGQWRGEWGVYDTAERRTWWGGKKRAEYWRSQGWENCRRAMEVRLVIKQRHWREEQLEGQLEDLGS
jgi:hypothetical protein